MSGPGEAVFEGARWSQPVVLSAATGTVPLDFTLSNRYEVLAIGNITFANPTGNIPAQLVGQTMTVSVKQDGTGGRTVSFGSAYIVPTGTTASTAANATDIYRLDYLSTGSVRVSLQAQAGQSAAAITGGTIDATVIGGTTPAAGSFTNLSSSGYFRESVGNALTAVGTNRATALQLAAQINNVTTAAASTGVSLPAGSSIGIGATIYVYNAGANPIQVYGLGSDTIDGVAGATGVPLANAKRCGYTLVAANTFISAQLGAVSA